MKRLRVIVAQPMSMDPQHAHESMSHPNASDAPAKLAKSAEVVAAEPNQSFDIAYDDGDSESQVAIGNLKPLRAKHTPAQTVADSKDKSDKADAVLSAPSTPAAPSIDAAQLTPVWRISVASEKAAVAPPSASKAAVAITAPQQHADTPAATAAQATAAQASSSSSSSSSTSSWTHAVGDRVEAKSHGQWHTGTVVTHCASSCYGITYDTGEKEINVPEKRLRLPVQRLVRPLYISACCIKL
jgi:hypothetical protein